MRISVFIKDDIWKRFQEYKKQVWGDSQSTSAIIQRALREFLDRESEKTTEVAVEKEGKGNGLGY